MDELLQRYRAWVLSQDVCGSNPREVDDDRIVIEVGQIVAEVNFYREQNARTIVELLVMTSPDEVPAFFLHFVLEDLARAQELFQEMSQALESEMDAFVTKVLLCCTSGMTTTFFASKMGEVARGLSLPYEFSAMSFDRALAASDDYAAIMLAPQAIFDSRWRRLIPIPWCSKCPAKSLAATMRRRQSSSSCMRCTTCTLRERTPATFMPCGTCQTTSAY